MSDDDEPSFADLNADLRALLRVLQEIDQALGKLVAGAAERPLSPVEKKKTKPRCRTPDDCPNA
jgi:hypothetical protein